MAEVSRGAVLDYLALRFGGLLREEQVPVTVGVTATALTQHDGERVSLVVANLSANDVYITPDASPAVTRGLRVPSGGIISFSVDEDGILPALAWSGISGVAGSGVYVLSVRRDVSVAPLARV